MEKLVGGSVAVHIHAQISAILGPVPSVWPLVHQGVAIVGTKLKKPQGVERKPGGAAEGNAEDCLLVSNTAAK